MDRVAALAVSAPEVETLSQWESASLKVLRQKARSGQYTACQNVAAVLNPKRRHARAAPGRAPGAVQSSILDAGCPTSAPCPRRVS